MGNRALQQWRSEDIPKTTCILSLHQQSQKLVVLMDPAVDENDDVLRQNRSREKQFMFDLALDGTATQQEIYEKTCKFLIPGVINGFNATVFAYGATGAGKTYTMLGRDDHPGIMAHALSELFTQMKRGKDDHVYKVTMSYLEIYNEMIRDLLNPGSGFLELREDQKGVQVAGLSEHSALSTDQVMSILKGGNKERTQEPTAANKTSSRSHAVLIVSVKQRQRVPGIHQQVRVGKLFLIDLAGSERAANTQNRGKRMVEGAHINRSLLALGNCINALSDKHPGGRYVNYRDSKLTRLLKDALSGNCKTVMIAHISPASFNFEESRNTLSYADRAKNIRTKVRQNVLDMTLHIAQYSSIIADLRDEIRRLRQKVDHHQPGSRKQSIIASTTAAAELVVGDYESDFTRLKNELLSALQTQTNLRQELLEMVNSESANNVEAMRLDLFVNRLEHEQLCPALQRDDIIDEKDSSESMDVNQLRDELEAVQKQRSQSEKKRVAIDRQLVDAANNIKKIQQELRQLCESQALSADQLDLVQLLDKLHALQVDNSELQCQLVAARLDVRRRDLLIDCQHHHDSVAATVISRQRRLIDDNAIYRPTDLQMLDDVCDKQTQQIHNLRNSGAFLPAISSNKNLVRQGAVDERHTNNLSSPHDTSNATRLFVHRSTAGPDVAPRDRPSGLVVVSSLSPHTGANSPTADTHDGHDGHAVAGHTDGHVVGREDDDDVEDLILDQESRRVMMMNNTRSIAQLAASRRAARHQQRPPPPSCLVTSDLTASRLAQHNSNYAPLNNVHSRHDDVMSYTTNTTMNSRLNATRRQKPNHAATKASHNGFQPLPTNSETKIGSKPPPLPPTTTATTTGGSDVAGGRSVQASRLRPLRTYPHHHNSPAAAQRGQAGPTGTAATTTSVGPTTQLTTRVNVQQLAWNDSSSGAAAAADRMAVEDSSRYRKPRPKKSTGAAAAAIGATALSSALPAASNNTDDTMSITGYAIH